MVVEARRFWRIAICLFGMVGMVGMAAPASAQPGLVPSDWTIYITNDACSDYTWGFDEQQTRKAFADVIAAHLDEMNRTDREPEENRDHYNLSITQEGAVFLEYYPERKAEFLRRIHEGRISVGAFLNNNLWGFQSLESELRDLYPARRMEEEWGISIRDAEHIEEPALPWGAASILAASGFRWLIVPFLDYDSTFSQLDVPVFFNLQGPDGGQVRVLMDQWASEKANYAQGRYLLKDPKRIEEEWLPHYSQAGASYPLKVILASGTHSDNGPGISALAPVFADGIIQYNARTAPHAKLMNATLPQFLDQVDQAETKQPFMPTVRGDFGQAWDVWPVTLADFAMRMRSGERSFLAAESLLAVAARNQPAVIEGAKATHQDAEWNLTMLADHAWNGKGAANANVNADLRRNWSLQLTKLSGQLEQKGWSAAGLVAGSKNVTLFNSLSTPRADLVSIPVPASVGAVKGVASQVVDEQGQRMLYFVSPRMQGFSFATLPLGPLHQKAGKMLSASPFALESPFYRLRIDPETGGIGSLIDQATGRELRVPGQNTIGQTVLFNGQEHELTHVHSEVVARGAVLARIRVTGNTQGIEVTNFITVYADLDRVDLDIRIHQPVSTEEHRITQSFPIMGADATERIETTGAVVRPFPQPAGDLLPGANPRQFAVQGFVDTSAATGGVTVAPLDAFVLRQDIGPITFEAIGNDQNYKEGTRDQHGVTDFRLRYSLRAHTSGYNGAEVFPWSRSVATPILAQLGVVPLRVLHQPAVEVDPSRAIATAFKAADGEGNLLRIWETAGSSGPMTVAIPGYRRAMLTDLLERDLGPLPIEQGKIRLPLAARGFAAVRLLP